MKKIYAILLLFAFALPAVQAGAVEKQTLFVHLKTSLKHDDAQICVAYNVIWAALKEGMAVNVLVDADGINTFKRGIFSDKDAIQDYKIPENLRTSIARQLNVPPDDVPKTYGDYLILLHKEGAQFYVNKGFLIVAGIAPEPDKDMGKLADYAKKIFKPVTFKRMLELRKNADFDYSY